MQPHLDRLYSSQAREFTLNACTLTEFADWKAAFRNELARLLCLPVNPKGLADETGAFTSEIYHPSTNPFEPETFRVSAPNDRGTCIEEKYYIDAGEGVQTPLYLLIPKREPPFRPVLVFHGHDPSAQYCLGNYPDPETARANRAIDNHYALALAEAGYLVGVVEQRGLGERLTDQVSAAGRTCRHLAFSYLMHGRTLMGERIRDGMCAVTYLLSRPDVAGSLGCTGHSAGGATALWLAALDERVAVTVVSGYFSSFRASILAREHCECNYVPGILALAEVGDLAALLAPRPFCALNGRQDELFPVGAAVEQFEIVRRAYALHGADDACCLSIHPGGHAYNNAMAHAWLARW
jgi:hypothetical protein